MEKRHNYLRKVCETATNCFISEDRPNVKGLVLVYLLLILLMVVPPDSIKLFN